MLFGMLQFHFGQNIFGDVGLKPTQSKKLKKKIKMMILQERLLLIGFL
jgi:hypothetical protein